MKPHFDTWEEEEAYYAAKAKFPLNKISTFAPDLWKVVKDDLRPTLTRLVLEGKWEEVAEFWAQNRWMVEMAVLGK